MEVVLLFVGILVGFVIPGFLLNKIVNNDNDFGAAYIVSTVILFQVVFWIGICGFKISLISVGTLLVLINLFLFFYCLVKGIEFKTSTSPNPLFTKIEKIALIPVLLSILLIFLKSSIFNSNSMGDQVFRWFFLASRILETGTFSYYPPLSPDDYNLYFYTDSFPPIVSFSYFWLYSLFGKPENVLVCIPVTLQFILILVFGYRLSMALFNSKQTGIFSILLMGSSTLLFYSVMISQETGITALSMLALIFFLVRRSPCSSGDILMAAFAASLGALSREYGGIFILCGVIVILWRKMPLKTLIFYLFFCSILTAPWYIRTLILTGNPFYSNPVGGLLSVNEVHAGILEGYKESIGLRSYMTTKVVLPLASGLSMALGISFFTGLISALMQFKRLGFFIILTSLILILWTYSMQIVPGGIFHSMRMLSPIIVLNSVCGASLLLLFTGIHRRAYLLILFTLSILCLITFMQNIFVPYNPFKIKTGNGLLRAASILPDPELDPDEVFNTFKEVPDNSKILSDTPYTHALLAMQPTRNRNISLIPVWSPDVAFLFKNDTSFEENCIRLREKGIRYVLIGRTNNLNMNYLKKFEFFRKYPAFSKPLDEGKNLFLLPTPIPTFVQH